MVKLTEEQKEEHRVVEEARAANGCPVLAIELIDKETCETLAP